MSQSIELAGGVQLPTIGIEIELPWKFMLRRVDPEAADVLGRYGLYWRLTDTDSNPEDRLRLEAGFDAVDAVYKPIVAQALASGIDKGGDGFVEFAHRPKHDYQDLLSEVDLLYNLDLLRDGEQYPLHLTLGNMRLSKEAYWLLMGCELLNPAMPERLKQTGTWAVKGRGGLRERKPQELQLGAPYAVEFRTLVLHDRNTLAETLRFAQLGGAIVCMVQQGQTNQQQQEEWKAYVAALQVFACRNALDISHTWPSAHSDPGLWQRYADGFADEQGRKGVLTAVRQLGSIASQSIGMVQ